MQQRNISIRFITADIQIEEEKPFEVIPLDELNRAINQVNRNIDNFDSGTLYELAALFLTVLRRASKVTETHPELIGDEFFEKSVLNVLIKLIPYYQYYVDYANVLDEAKPKKYPYKYYSLFINNSFIGRRNRLLNINDNKDNEHPSTLLTKYAFALEHDDHPFSNIYPCRDVHCSLTLLQLGSVVNYVNTENRMMKNFFTLLTPASNVLWVSFAAGNLGLTLSRLSRLFDEINMKRVPCPRSIDVALIDPEYGSVIQRKKRESEEKIDMVKEGFSAEVINTDHIEVAIKQFCRFLVSKAPVELKVNLRVCDSTDSFKKSAAECPRFDAAFVEADDIWVPGGNVHEKATPLAQSDFQSLLQFINSKTAAGCGLSVFKNDQAGIAEIVCYSFSPFSIISKDTLHTEMQQYPYQYR